MATRASRLTRPAAPIASIDITTAGKLLGGCLAVFGIASFALPTAILGAAFPEELQRARGSDPHASCPMCGWPPADDAGRAGTS